MGMQKGGRARWAREKSKRKKRKKENEHDPEKTRDVGGKTAGD